MNEWSDEETAIRQMFVDMNQCFLRADFATRSKFLTADSLTLQNRAILRCSSRGIGMEDRQTRISALIPTLCSSLTECWVGLVFSSPAAAM